MNQNQSGETKSVRGQIEEFNNENQAFLEKLEFVNLSGSSSHLVRLRADELYSDKYTPEECAMAAFMLNQYAVYLQNQFNKYYSEHNYANSKLMKIIGQRGAEYDGQYLNFEERKARIIASDSAAQSWQDTIVENKGKMDMLTNQVRNVHKMADALSDMGRAKKRYGRNTDF